MVARRETGGALSGVLPSTVWIVSCRDGAAGAAKAGATARRLALALGGKVETGDGGDDDDNLPIAGAAVLSNRYYTTRLTLRFGSADAAIAAVGDRRASPPGALVVVAGPAEAAASLPRALKALAGLGDARVALVDWGENENKGTGGGDENGGTPTVCAGCGGFHLAAPGWGGAACTAVGLSASALDADAEVVTTCLQDSDRDAALAAAAEAANAEPCGVARVRAALEACCWVGLRAAELNPTAGYAARPDDDEDNDDGPDSADVAGFKALLADLGRHCSRLDMAGSRGDGDGGFGDDDTARRDAAEALATRLLSVFGGDGDEDVIDGGSSGTCGEGCGGEDGAAPAGG